MYPSRCGPSGICKSRMSCGLFCVTPLPYLFTFVNPSHLHRKTAKKIHPPEGQNFTTPSKTSSSSSLYSKSSLSITLLSSKKKRSPLSRTPLRCLTKIFLEEKLVLQSYTHSLNPPKNVRYLLHRCAIFTVSPHSSQINFSISNPNFSQTIFK